MEDYYFDRTGKEFCQNDEEIMKRTKQIDKVSKYDVHLWLQQGNSYSGKVVISLILKEAFQDLLVDFKGRRVLSVKQKESDENEWKNCKNWTFTRQRIHIQKCDNIKDSRKDFKHNIDIEICFQTDYSTRQDKGLYSLITDQHHQYLYSQGEVGSMHLIFPCFDQIDFHAVLALTLTHPSHWICSANMPILKHTIIPKNTPSPISYYLDSSKTIEYQGKNEEEKGETILEKEQKDGTNLNPIEIVASKEYATSVFQETLPFPCYLFGIFAGDYSKYKFNVREGLEGSFLVRKEKSKQLENQLSELIDITRFGFEFMETYTQVPFYLPKIDQIFCANYNSYGMENPGCISLEEKRYLFEEPREPLKQLRRAYIMLHEIAHMWFGDYMTIDWWNNLFLKEGFATFFGNKMIKEYFPKEEQQGYLSELEKIHILPDDNSSSQPSISLSGEKLDFYDYECMKAHNCISYEKGGAFFSFLESKVYRGDEFRDRVRQYLKDHSFKASTIQSFLKFFPSEMSNKYVFTKGVSYLESGVLKSIMTLNLTKEEYQVFNLTKWVLNRADNKLVLQQLEIELSANDGSQQPNQSNQDSKQEDLPKVEFLNQIDGHLIFCRLSEQAFNDLFQPEIFVNMNLQQRVSLWKCLFFECISFSPKEIFNSLFLSCIQFEQNYVTLHFVLRSYGEYCLPFSDEHQLKLIAIYEEQTDQISKRIFLKNLIRFLKSQECLLKLLSYFGNEERTVKYKYLKQLKEKLINPTSELAEILEKLIIPVRPTGK